MNRTFTLGFIFLVIIVACASFFLKFRLPIPSDTIVGLYHPFRDVYAATNPNGVPYKNFLITDPVRQIIPWKSLSIELMRSGQLPLWNPYQMSGAPLLANFQSSPFYPLNLLLFIHPFAYSWSALVILQLFLAAFFMYWYLHNVSLKPLAVIFGTVSYIFSGFFVAWFEWGTIVQTALWLPLVLLSTDQIVVKRKYRWTIVLFLALTCSFFAGHLQTFFYIVLISTAYALARFIQTGFNSRSIAVLFFACAGAAVITAIQWIPTFQYIFLSSRSLDQSPLTQAGWFLPWQHLAQFLAPDFFGNVTTLNYWGTWNYGELVGYAGIIAFLFAVFASLFRHDKKTWFFLGVVLVSLSFMVPSPVASLPFNLHIPFISTAQPTRLMVLVDFALAVLAALGFDYFLKLEPGREKAMITIFTSFFVAAGLAVLWGVVLAKGKLFGITPENIAVARHNLYLPTIVLGSGIVLLLVASLFKKPKYVFMIMLVVLLLQTGDVIRFFQKFEPFTHVSYFFASTPATDYLQLHSRNYRIASVDSRIMPPNFPTYYHLQSIEGYDPLYLQSYAEFISALQRGMPDISPPFGFNRIITPHNITSPLFDLLSVKYVLSLSELKVNGYKTVFNEGETKVYQNTNVLPRAFFVNSVRNVANKQTDIQQLFQINHKTTAVTEGYSNQSSLEVGGVEILKYTANEVLLQTKNDKKGFLVLLDIYYPTWRAYVDGHETKIYKTDYTFRGIVVPAGSHTVEFKDFLL